MIDEKSIKNIENLYNFFHNFPELIKDIDKNEKRKEILRQTIDNFEEIKVIFENFEKNSFSEECKKSINLLKYMENEIDPFEKDFVESLKNTAKNFLPVISEILNEARIKIEEDKEKMHLALEDINDDPEDIVIDEETKDFIFSFVSEAQDLLDEAEPMIEKLSEEDNLNAVNTIFRLFHSLKGLAAFLNFEIVKSVTHEAETLLDIFRVHSRKVSQENITLLYKTCDFLRKMIEDIQNSFTDKKFKKTSESIIKMIKLAIMNLTGEDNLENENEEPLKSDEENEEFNFEITTEMIERYLSETSELISNASRYLLVLEKEPENKELIRDIFGYVHSIKGNSGFLGFTDIEEIAMDIETVLDDVRNEKLNINKDIINVLLSALDAIEITINEMSKESYENIKIKNKEKIKANMKKYQIEKVEEYKPLGEILVEYGGVSPEAVDKALDLQSKPIGKILVELGETNEETVEKALKIQNELKGKTQASSQQQQTIKKDIRVDANKLDKLFNLVGELITAEAMVINNPDLEGLELHNFNKATGMLNKITRELQEITMSIRMMPLDGLFNKMKRLIRDLSEKFKKKINFNISGQETEMDKNVIDEISDPLVHILRNSVDHGIEMPEERIKKGKDEVGNINLSARYEGNEILITIEDDGAGLNREKILAKAIEKGLVKGNPEKLTDEEVWKFIFEPGFSTAEKVSEISGRGVGMDVVKKNIEKLRGQINVFSKFGKGTTFILRIPLTLAIMDVMLIRVGNTKYAVPILSIRESFRPDKESITVTMDNQEVVKVRDELFSVIRLHELFKKEPDSYKLEEGILIIIESHNKKACLFVDEILGQQQTVVKGLSDYIGKIQGITGCMILADGEIGLILDIEGILSIND